MRSLAKAAVLFACLSGCAKKSAENELRPADAAGRREGLWVQTISRDGRPQALGRFQLCVDPATDEKLTLIGAAATKARCDRRTSRQLDGAVSFTSRCRIGREGLVETRGKVWSDYRSSYRLHAESVVTGSPFDALNGQHVTDISARYIGPCPADMAPGDAILGPGLKVNLRKMPMAVMGG